MQHVPFRDQRKNLIRRAALETLESRRLLCSSHYDPIAFPAPEWKDSIEQDFADTRNSEGGPEAVSIVWTNKGVYSGASDSRFDDVFGTSATAAEAVVQAALDAWENVITSFNRDDGSSTLQVSITMTTALGTGGAGGPASTAPADGKPRTGSITLNAGNNSADPNDDNGWFLDPTPNDYSEFQGDIINAFSGNRTSVVGGDLYSVVAAEVTHSLGLISAKPGSSSFSGYRLETSGFNTFTGVADNAEGGGNKGFFYTFDGPTIDHLMTSYNSGDSDADSWGNVIHTAGGTADISYNGRTWRGTEDDGNAGSDGERNLPSYVTANIFKDAYGYTIADPAKFGTMYSVRDQNTNVINVRGADNSNDTISITRSGNTLIVSVDLPQDVPGSHAQPGAVNAPAWTTEYSIFEAAQINVFPGTGNDTIVLSADLNATPVLVVGAAGTDKLQIVGNAGYDSFSTPGFGEINTTSAQVAYTGIESLEIFTGDGNADIDLPSVIASSARITGGPAAQTINFGRLDIGTPTVIDLGNGNDILNFATGDGVNPVRSPVTIFGVGGDDVINIAPSDFASTVITQPVTIFGDAGNDTLVLGSNNADSIDVNLTFDGGTHVGGTGDRIVINDTAVPYNVRYDIAPSTITRDGFNLPRTTSFTNTEGITINAGSGADTVAVSNGVGPFINAFGNNGNDNFIVGGGNLSGTFPQNFNGGAGTDQITFDDHLDTTNRIWDVKPNEVIFGGLISLFTTAFESVGILAGTGADEITFAGQINQALNIDAGGGSDTFILGFQNSVTFFNPVTLVGGSQGTTFNINDAQVYFFASLLMDGGNGFNYLNVNIPNATNFILGEGYFRRDGGSTAPFSYTNINTKTFNGNALNNVYTVYSAGSDFGTFTLNGNLGDDSFLLAPQPSGYTFKNLTLNGNQGTDTYVYDATALSEANSYTVGTNFITRQIGGFGSETVTTASMNTITLTCGGGDDSIFMSQYSAGIPVTVNGGLGDDVCNFGGNDVAANITSIPSFLFNGNEGIDTFNLRNGTPNNSFTYGIPGNTTLQLSRSLPSPYFISLEYYNTEQKHVYAGPAVDVMNITAFASGELSFHGGAGDDTMNLPTSSDFIGRRVNFFGDAGTLNRITQSSNTKNTPTTMHVYQNSIGAFPGDNFFAAGGSVHFDSVQTMALRMGTGADTAYIEPNPIARINLSGDLPFLPGDQLNLALAATTNLVFSGSGANGSMTSSDRATITYTGFEVGPTIDDIAPAVVSAEINLDGAPGFAEGVIRQSLDVQFSEDVSALLSAESLQLDNLTTGQTIPSTNIAVEYLAATNTARFTFPGYENGVLPDGNYAGMILQGLPDAFGNSLPAAVNFGFFFLNGDANHDRAVNINDFAILASRFNLPGTFSQGDFDYNGVTNISDFALLASRFNTSLPAPANLPRQSGESLRPERGVFSQVAVEEDELVGLVG